MNHEIICKYCEKDRRLNYGCCKEILDEEDRIINEEIDAAEKLISIFNKNSIFTYYSDVGGVKIPQSEVVKVIKLLGG